MTSGGGRWVAPRHSPDFVLSCSLAHSCIYSLIQLPCPITALPFSRRPPPPPCESQNPSPCSSLSPLPGTLLTASAAVSPHLPALHVSCPLLSPHPSAGNPTQPPRFPESQTQRPTYRPDVPTWGPEVGSQPPCLPRTCSLLPVAQTHSLGSPDSSFSDTHSRSICRPHHLCPQNSAANGSVPASTGITQSGQNSSLARIVAITQTGLPAPSLPPHRGPHITDQQSQILACQRGPCKGPASPSSHHI